MGHDALFRSGQGHGRQVVEAGPGRQQELDQPLLGRCRAHVVERVRVGEGEWARRRTAQRPEIPRAVDGLPEIAGECPDVGAGRTRHVDHRGWVLRVRLVPPDERELVEGHGAGLQLGRLAPPRERIGPAATDLARRERRRPLLLHAAEATQGSLDGVARRVERPRRA